MTQGGNRMKRGNGLILAVMAAFAAACASGGGGETGAPGSGNSPRDNQHTNAAGVHLMQAGLAEGEEVRSHYESALADAIIAIQQDSTNPKGYLMAGQAAIGLEDWVQADTMLARALELYPGYETQVVSEREQGWVDAYNRGAEALNAGDLDRAVALFAGADLLYQERPEARMALGSLYLRRGDTEQAIEAYVGALDILSGPMPEGLAEEQQAAWAQDRQVAAFNAAQLLSQTGQYGEAADLLEGFLERNADQIDAGTELRAQTALAGFLAQAGRTEAAEALYSQILDRDDLTSAEYFQIGIGFFNTGDYTRAGDAFRAAAEMNPYSRDALLNLVQSRYAEALDLEEMEEQTEAHTARIHELYDGILEAAEQVRTFDPLNRNVITFMLRALRAKADLVEESEAQELTRRTQDLFRSYQEQPYEVADIALTIEDDTTARITGALTNLGGTEGESVSLRFSVVDSSGNEIDAAVVTITVPAEGETRQFATTVDIGGGEFAGWQYELVD